MTADDRDAIYERLQTLQDVDIDHAIERGKDYLIERLMDCRRRQDECGQLAVRVKRAMFAAKVARRRAKSAATLSKASSDDDVHRDAEDQYDEMKALEESVGVARATLRAADSDIRLAAGLLGMQIVLGQPGTPVASDVAAPVVVTPSEAAPSAEAAALTFDTLFGTTAVSTSEPSALNGTVAPGRPASVTVLADVDEIDLDALLS
jgi:hypothetical protein